VTDSAADVAAILERTIATLEAAHARDEALAEVKLPRKVAVFTVGMSFVPAGRAWRLGTVLLDREASLYSTGGATRAVQPKDFIANKSPDAELRRTEQRAATKARFADGEAVNHGYTPIATDRDALASGDGRLWLDGDVVMLRLEGTSSAELERYLTDRAKLLIDPS